MVKRFRFRVVLLPWLGNEDLLSPPPAFRHIAQEHGGSISYIQAFDKGLR